MKIIVQPQKSAYKLLFVEGDRVEGTGFVTLTATQKGQRPKNFKMRRRGSRQPAPTPTRDFIAMLRRSMVLLAAESPEFESFLSDLQIPFSHI
ncbi:MAG TPA: DEAD/DEAH box helicase, partial [Methanoculleus sp.]|nr:DEAD/DEAH box helicase [Methanoculleus sp.]